MRRVILLAAALFILGVFNWNIYQKETLIRDGHTVLLRLAPVDPRSLIQGDYMRLNYVISREVERKTGQKVSRRGSLVITLDEHGVASFIRLHEGETLGAGEYLLNYKRRGRVHVAAESYLFQEGHAEVYARARYGELRVCGSGESVLVGLRDEQYRPLGPEPPGEPPAPITD